MNFDNSSTGQIESYLWEFGDGHTSLSFSPSHEYQNPGTYTVSLTATGPGGSNKKTEPNYISVDNPCGIIEGFVHTSTGDPVQGVQICADPGNYCTNTIEDGTYRITDIMYGSYTVTPALADHIFDPVAIPVTINSTDPVPANFTDMSVFPVSGYVKYLGTNCPVEGVHILDGPDETSPPTVTGADGSFSANFDYGTHTITPSLAGHTFSPPYFSGMIDAPVAGMLFESELTYSLSGKVVGGCDYLIGQAQLTITSTNGCYSTIITTSTFDGTFSIDLPPLIYYVEIDVPSNPLITIETQTVDLTQGDQILDIIYHNPIEIEFSGFPEPLSGCQVPILQQGQSYPIEITAFERYGEDICPLEGAEVTIYDNIGDIDNAITAQLVNGSVSYTILAGEPNTLPGGEHPYQKQFEVHISAGASSTSLDQWVIVEGHKPREQTYTTVSPELPFFILRDPPGDESYSLLSQSNTLCLTNSMAFQQEGSVGVFAKAKIGLDLSIGFLGVSGNIGAALTVEGSAEYGEGSISQEEMGVCISSRTTFMTSDQQDIVGTDGDVFGGAAINLIYAITDVLKVNEYCEPVVTQNVAWNGDGFNTYYLYTESHIREVLIPQLEATDQTDDAFLWQDVLDYNVQLKLGANFIINRSFSAGATTEYSESITLAESQSIEFYTYVDAEVATSAGLEVFGSGGELGIKVKGSWNIGKAQTIAFEHTNNVGYSLKDNDPGDYFSVDIKADDVFGTPVFELVSGASSCPWEHPTAPREGVTITIDPNEQNDILPEDAAVFTLYLGNTSQTSESREYYLAVVQESNPYGAIIAIGGVPLEQSLSYTIPAGQQIEATMTVERGPEMYDYNNLHVELYSGCDHNQIADTVTFSVSFIPPCTGISINSPDNNWVINQSNNDTLQVILTEYDLNDPNLLNLKLQYTRFGENNWISYQTIVKGNLSPDYIIVNWDVSALNDGDYQIRGIAECSAGENISEILTGTIDRNPPEPFGSPQPADGILSIGDAVSIIFTESIDCNTVSPDCVTLMFENDGTQINIQTGCSSQEIVITPVIESIFIENQVLTAMVSCITDAYGNMLSQPIDWSFYVDQNSVRWDPINISTSLIEGESGSLSSTLKNDGGLEETFGITDYKEWITPQTVSGAIPPGGAIPIEFIISDTLSPGVHIDTVYAQTNGGSEPVYLSVTVLCPPPSWQVIPGNFEFNMSLTGVILFDDIESTDPNDIIAAFVGDEVRGVANPTYFPGTERYTFGMPIYSNVASGEIIAFKAYDASECSIYNTVSETIGFTPDGIIGNDMNPEVFHASRTLLLAINFSAGWNWFSLNAIGPDMSLSSILEPLAADATFIKSQIAFSTNYGGETGWYGELNTIDIHSMYMIKVNEDCELVHEGFPVDYQNTPIQLVTGWNWIGFLPQTTVDINTALTSISNNGLFIKSQIAFSTYYGGEIGWYGGLEYMEPGKGYKLKMIAEDDLIYSTQGSGVPSRVTEVMTPSVAALPAALPSAWNVNVHSHEHSMAITGMLEIDGVESTSPNIVVGAFVDNDCRGIAGLIQFPLNNRFIFCLLVHGESIEPINFRIYNSENNLEQNIASSIQFKEDAILGNGLDPIVIRATTLSTEDIGNIPDKYVLMQNYPNPFNQMTVISYGLPERSFVRLIVYDIRGRLVAELANEEQSEGWYHITWDATGSAGKQLISGIYFVKIDAGTFTGVKKMILLK